MAPWRTHALRRRVCGGCASPLTGKCGGLVAGARGSKSTPRRQTSSTRLAGGSTAPPGQLWVLGVNLVPLWSEKRRPGLETLSTVNPPTGASEASDAEGEEVIAFEEGTRSGGAGQSVSSERFQLQQSDADARRDGLSTAAALAGATAGAAASSNGVVPLANGNVEVGASAGGMLQELSPSDGTSPTASLDNGVGKICAGDGERGWLPQRWKVRQLAEPSELYKSSKVEPHVRTVQFWRAAQRVGVASAQTVCGPCACEPLSQPRFKF